MRFPSNQIEFQDRFPDEESCWRHPREVRWPAGFECPRCGEQASSFIQTRRLEQCRRCRYQASVTAGTICHRPRTPLRVWFLGVFFLARHKTGVSALQFQKDAGIGNYQTAWTMLHKLRSALGPRPEDKLTGLVEVDESYIGGKEPGLRGGRRLVGKTFAAELHLATSTVSRILLRIGLGKLWRVEAEAVPERRYEHEKPGALVHIDAKKFARIERIGHRIHGDRGREVRGGGWECTFVAVDDCTRLAHAEMHASENAPCAT